MNEEVQSTNEELGTINDELHQRTDDLNDVNAFVEAVLGSLNAGVVVVDRELRGRAGNGAAHALWGRPGGEVAARHSLTPDTGLPVAQLPQPIRDTLTGKADGPDA